jgi:glycosyltransferase involved in cell wall biosynthesis
VLIVGGTGGATWRYRGLHHREQLKLRAVPVRSMMQWHPDLLDAGLGCGLVILHRVAWDPGVQALIDQTRDAGGVVLYDIDDLVFEPESTHLHHGLSLLSPRDQALYHDGVRRYRRCLLACDGAIAPTEFLAGRVRRLGKPAWVSRNCVDLEILQRSDEAMAARPSGGRAAGEGVAGDPTAGSPPSDRLVVGYASGSRTHDRDFGAAAGPALLRLMAHRDDFVLRLIGPLELGPEWAPFQERVQRVPAVDWRTLPAVLADFDLSLAPLEIDNPFCQAKSELKWLEAAAVGVPSVASATGAFRTAIEAANAQQGAETGWLATDSQDWFSAVTALLDDGARREAMGAAARRAVEERRSTAGQARAYERTLAEAATTVRPAIAPPAPPQRAAHGMTINLLMPEPPRGSGGHTSIMRLVGGLDAAGHAVTVHIDPGANMSHATEAEAAAFMRAHFPRSGCTFRLGRDLAPADVAIATGWTTARAVAHATNARTKLYLVQDFEPFFQGLGADWLAAEATYRLGLGHITLGPWLARTLRERYGARAQHIDFGVNHATYHPDPSRAKKAIPPVADIGTWVQDPRAAQTPRLDTGAPPRIVFYGRASTPRRGVALGLEALAKVKAARPEVEIVLYGGDTPGLAEFPYVHAGVLTQQELADLYRSATCGLALSYTNLSFVPLEMAACGLPVVAVATEPCAWYQEEMGETCAVAPPTADGIADALLRVIDDAALRARLVAGGRAAVADWSWERSVAQFVAHVTAYADEDLAQLRSGEGPLTGPPPQHPATVRLESGSIDVIDPTTEADHGAAIVDRPRVLRPGEHVTWPLRTHLDGLHRVELRMAAATDLPAQGYLVLGLYEHASAPRALATATVDARILPEDDTGWTSFLLGPLHGVRGHTLDARLRYVARQAADGDAQAAQDAPSDGESTPLTAASDAVRIIVGVVTRDAEDGDAGGGDAGGGEGDGVEGDAGGAGSGPLDLDGAGGIPTAQPRWRAFGLAELEAKATDAAGTIDIAPIDTALAEALRQRRRAAAAARVARVRLEARPWLHAAIRGWLTLTRPLPPVPLRPWPADAKGATKLWRAMRTYGPLRLARELGIWRRWRLGKERRP